MSEVAVLLLTEDASKFAFERDKHVCRRIFDCLTPQVRDGDWLSFAPANEAARAAMVANM